MPRQKRTNSPIKHTSPKKPNSKQGAFKIAGVGELTERKRKKKNVRSLMFPQTKAREPIGELFLIVKWK